LAPRATALQRILLVDDPSHTTVSTDDGMRPARVGERHSFDQLAAALASKAGVPAVVRDDFAGAVEPGTAVIIDPSLVQRLLRDAAEARGRTVVVGAAREAIGPMLALQGFAAVVEAQQFWKWRSEGPADAAVYGDLDLASRLARDVQLTPLGDSRFGRIRIDGGDLPGLLADYLQLIAER
jgi:hypothetical protein